MALTQAQLKEILSAAGVASENMSAAVTKIMDGHIASIDALREERDAYKADAEKFEAAQKELSELKAQGDQNWQQKAEAAIKELADYKKQVSDERTAAQIESLYRGLLKSENVAENRIDSIIRITDFSKMRVKDNKLENESDLRDNIKTEWGGFIMEVGTKGANVATPPSQGAPQSSFETLSLAEKMAYANEHPTEQAVIDWLRN